MRKDAELGRRAEKHHGIFSLVDASDVGFTEDERHERLASGLWVSLHDNAYRFAGTPMTWRGMLLAACWAGGFRSCASHRSALGLRDLPGGRRHVAEIVT